MKAIKYAGLAVLGLMLVFLAIGLSTGDKSTAKPPTPPQEALAVVSSIQLARDYDANSVAADQKYKGRRFKVTGVVREINTNFMGEPVIVMDGVNQFSQPHFSFDKNNADQIAEVRKGEKIALVCVGRGDVVKSPMSGDCTISD